MTQDQQDTLIEAIVGKLEQLADSHNSLVRVNHAMLTQINELTLKVQRLEAMIPDRSDDV